ncbi:MAG TPA: hypothetical protein VKB53_10125 [Gammaproteobacteria bacterium]|nr:hypothetical protein [Gammaproteobacteria bacterium]
MSQHEHSEAETWLRLARKCNDTQLAEYLRTLAVDAAKRVPGPKIPDYSLGEQKLVQRVGTIISEAVSGSSR